MYEYTCEGRQHLESSHHLLKKLKRVVQLERLNTEIGMVFHIPLIQSYFFRSAQCDS